MTARKNHIKLYITLFENICLADNAPHFSRGFLFPRKNDYIGMRIISDELYAHLVKVLAQDEKVAVFQQLILAQRAEPAEKPDEIKTVEDKQ